MRRARRKKKVGRKRRWKRSVKRKKPRGEVGRLGRPRYWERGERGASVTRNKSRK